MITRLLILLNLVGFAWEVSVAGPGMFSAMGSDAVARVYQQAAVAPYPVLVEHQWWRIISSGFLHAGLVHIAVNMISLYSLGRFIEAIIGSGRMALIYTISLIASGLAVVYMSPMDSAGAVGASGAIFGLFGALFAAGFKLGPRGMQLVRDNLGILVLNLVITFTVPGIAWQAHVGGLIAGFIVTFLIYSPPRRVAPVVVDAATGSEYETEYQAPPPHIQP